MAKTTDSATAQDLNLSVVIGEVATEPVARELSNGDVVTSLDIATHSPHGRITVPVLLEGECEGVEVGQRVFVCGVTRRRFFRAGNGVTSRTELLADVVVPVRRKTQVQRALHGAITDLKDFVSA